MITIKHIEIYKSYHGNGDGFARFANQKEKSIMSGNDWGFIDDIIQDLALAQRGLVSRTYLDVINQKMEERCDRMETIKELKKMAYNIK